VRFRLFFPLLCALATLWSSLSGAEPVSLALEHDNALGLSTGYLKEQDRRLDLADAVARFRAGEFTPGGTPVLNFGIGSRPVWVHFSVDNPTGRPIVRRLSIENSWQDSVEVHVQQQGRTLANYRLGDGKPFAQRPVDSRYFVFDQVFDPGVSDVYLRIETPDPMVVPIYLMSPDAARMREVRQEHSYGLVYGFLFALMAYNATLFASLRSSRYLLYSLYLGMFVVMNFAYTGHGYASIWPMSVKWQQWSNPILMCLYGFSGLLFATRFLDTRENFPTIHKAVLGFCAVVAALLAAAVLSGSQLLALIVAFVFAFLFSNVMLFLGVVAVHAGQKPARYFLIAAIAAMVGAVLTTLSVSGFIPYNAWTFRAVEFGMLLDATLLALALAYQFRVVQEDKIRAEQLAHLDPLTGLNNRRAIYDKTASLWSMALRNRRHASVMLIDIDLFKNINDTHGHAHGDQVLVAIAEKLRKSIREGDVLARWGGEEFIVYLPETSPQEARVLAERLRGEIADIRVSHATGETAVTASVGVAPKESHHATLDSLIAAADKFLYQSKQQGRNRVTCGFASE
jgi:diguanylate cyclase (GGDEF)-like protein